jgi:hypothetical protein
MDDTLRLPCKLSTHEVARRADELARVLEAHELLKADKAAAMSRFAEQIKASERRIFDLGDVVRNSCEFREVPVRLQSDFDRNQIHSIRMDTGEVVRSRPMESHERQQEIDYPGEESSTTTGEAH